MAQGIYKGRFLKGNWRSFVSLDLPWTLLLSRIQIGNLSRPLVSLVLIIQINAHPFRSVPTRSKGYWGFTKKPFPETCPLRFRSLCGLHESHCHCLFVVLICCGRGQTRQPPSRIALPAGNPPPPSNTLPASTRDRTCAPFYWSAAPADGPHALHSGPPHPLHCLRWLYSRDQCSLVTDALCPVEESYQRICWAT